MSFTNVLINEFHVVYKIILFNRTVTTYFISFNCCKFCCNSHVQILDSKAQAKVSKIELCWLLHIGSGCRLQICYCYRHRIRSSWSRVVVFDHLTDNDNSYTKIHKVNTTQKANNAKIQQTKLSCFKIGWLGFNGILSTQVAAVASYNTRPGNELGLFYTVSQKNAPTLKRYISEL